MLLAVFAVIAVVISVETAITPFVEAILKPRRVLRIFERFLMQYGAATMRFVSHVLLPLERVLGPAIATFPRVPVFHL